VAHFRDNAGLIDWVNQQPLNTPFFALGEGHDGIWNVFAEIGTSTHRLEILDWFHLMENLHKVPGSLNRLQQVEDLLWQGNVNAAIAVFEECHSDESQRFVAYLTRIAPGFPIMSICIKKGFRLAQGR
jgi:hypothetical protein